MDGDADNPPPAQRLVNIQAEVDLKRNLALLKKSELNTVRAISHSQKMLSAKYQNKLQNTITHWAKHPARENAKHHSVLTNTEETTQTDVKPVKKKPDELNTTQDRNQDSIHVDECGIEERDFTSILQWVWTNGSERMKDRRRKAHNQMTYDIMPGIEDRILATDLTALPPPPPGSRVSSSRSRRYSSARNTRFLPRPHTVMALDHGVLCTAEYISRRKETFKTQQDEMARSGEGTPKLRPRPATAFAKLDPESRSDESDVNTFSQPVTRRLPGGPNGRTLFPGQKEKRLAMLLQKSKNESKALQPKVHEFLDYLQNKSKTCFTEAKEVDYYGDKARREGREDVERKKRVLCQQQVSIDESGQWRPTTINQPDLSRPITAKEVILRGL